MNRVLEYDNRNLLRKVTDSLPSYGTDQYPAYVENTYNALGQKVKQHRYWQEYVCQPPEQEGPVQGGGDGTDGPIGGCWWVSHNDTHYYAWSGGELVWEYDAPTTSTYYHYYGLGQRLATRKLGTSADSLNTYVYDYLGNVRSFVRANGTTADRLIEYYPYGQIYSMNGAGASRFSFIDKETDWVRQLDFGPRYYDGVTGRFLGPDPILSASSAYSYSAGNPVMLVDPTGFLIPWTLTMQQEMEASQSDARTRKAVYEDEQAAYDMAMVTLQARADEELFDEMHPPRIPDPVDDDWEPILDDADSQNSDGGSNVIGASNRTPATGEPNTTEVLPNGTERTYGDDGRATKDIDPPHPDHDPETHAHDWDWSKDPPRQDRRDLTPAEQKDRERKQRDQAQSQMLDGFGWDPTPSWVRDYGTAAAIIYLIISEGSRIIPIRNLVPIP